jgi:phenylacetate-CoA ligase
MRRWLAWNVLFPLQEWAKGHPTFRILREMEAAERLSAGELEELRREKLRDLIQYSYAHVPYVRKCMQQSGVAPDRIRGPEDLALLPLMAKADVQKNREALRSDIAGKLASMATGGSTGAPLIFDIAKRRVASRVACRQRVDRWWGVSVGDAELALWGSPIELTSQDHLRTVRDTLLRTRLLSAFEMNDETMSRYLDILERGDFRQLFGYPSAIYLLCLKARRKGRNLRKLGVKAVFVTGEVLYPHQRELIAEVLNCPVANGYGGRDSGFIAHECPQGGMHVLADTVIIELLDSTGSPVAPGETGEIVVTDLYSHEAPFLRYATGDLAAWSVRPCPCGRALPLLERIEGRTNDCVVARDGRLINALALVYPVREVEGIEEFRICQKEIDRFAVQLVRNASFQTEGEERIRKAWESLLRSPVQVTFEYLPHLPPEPSGKYRHVVSELSAGSSLRAASANDVRPVPVGTQVGSS